MTDLELIRDDFAQRVHNSWGGERAAQAVQMLDWAINAIRIDAKRAAAVKAQLNINAALLLDRHWITIHYGLHHESVRLGYSWPDNCTDDPCPAIRAALVDDRSEATREPKEIRRTPLDLGQLANAVHKLKWCKAGDTWHTIAHDFDDEGNKLRADFAAAYEATYEPEL